MPAKARIVVTGIGKIDRFLRTLPFKVQGEVIRPAIRRSLNVEILPRVKKEAPVDTGALRKSIKTRAGLKRKRGEISFDVRLDAVEKLKKTSGKTGKTFFYPALVEYGTPHIPPNPFMRRAFIAGGNATRKLAIRLILAGIERVASRLA